MKQPSVFMTNRTPFRNEGRRESLHYEPGDLVHVTTQILSNVEKGLTAELSTKRDSPYYIKNNISPTAFEISRTDTDVVIAKHHLFYFTPFKNQSNSDAVAIKPIRKRGRPHRLSPVVEILVIPPKSRERPWKHQSGMC